MVSSESFDGVKQSTFNGMSLLPEGHKPQWRKPWTRRKYLDKGLVDMGLRWKQGISRVFLGLSDLPFGLQLKGVVGKSSFNKAVYEEHLISRRAGV